MDRRQTAPAAVFEETSNGYKLRTSTPSPSFEDAFSNDSEPSRRRHSRDARSQRKRLSPLQQQKLPLRPVNPGSLYRPESGPPGGMYARTKYGLELLDSCRSKSGK